MTDQSEIRRIKLDLLDLDTQNPRLPVSVGRTPEEMINHIALTTSIEDLMSAIAENGFFPGEPLIAVEENGRFVVVEGNRRLTAVKLLNNPSLCERPSNRMLELARSVGHKLDSLNELPVITRDTREEILPYLGFRHITGVKQWEPLAKARYIEQLFDTFGSTGTPDQRYFNVARAIGSRKDHIKRSLDALAVYKLMEGHEFYDIDGLNEESIKFSILSTALADDRIGKYVGISNPDEFGDAVPCHPIINQGVLHSNEVEELTRWLFEKDELGRTKIGESRNIRELSAVVDNAAALQSFKNGASLQIAY